MTAKQRRAVARLEQHRDVPAQVVELYRRRADAICKAVDAGLSVTEVAAQLGVKRKIVYDALADS